MVVIQFPIIRYKAAGNPGDDNWKELLKLTLLALLIIVFIFGLYYNLRY